MKVGIDIIEINRAKDDEKFLNKIAFEEEIEYINSFKCEEVKKQRIAALWCVKEAVFKCLGLGKGSKVTTKDVMLCHHENGKPYVKLFGIAKDTFDNLKLNEIEVSISHSVSFATAIAIAM